MRGALLGPGDAGKGLLDIGGGGVEDEAPVGEAGAEALEGGAAIGVAGAMGQEGADEFAEGVEGVKVGDGAAVELAQAVVDFLGFGGEVHGRETLRGEAGLLSHEGRNVRCARVGKWIMWHSRIT